MDHRNFDYQDDGTFRRSAHNGTDGSFTLATEMECEELIQANRRRREALAGAKDEVFRLAGSYPAPIVEKMMREGSFHDDDAWRKLMNDPEMRAFRVWEGRI